MTQNKKLKRLYHANYKIWKHLKTLCSCKCLSLPPYLKFTLSPMYKIKLKGKGKKKLTISTWNSSAVTYRDDIFPIGSILGLSSHIDFLQAIIELVSSRYHIIDHYPSTCIPPIPSLLEPSGRDMSKQTTPKLVVCTELIVCSSKPEK